MGQEKNTVLKRITSGAISCAISAAVLAGCGGGSGASTTPPLPGSGTQGVTLSVTVPGSNGVQLKNGRRVPAYVSRNTRGMGIDWSTVSASFNTAPASPTATASAAGGSLATGSYQYRLSAVSASGESLASAETAAAAVTGPTGSVALTWSAVSGATGYKIYGRTAGQERLIGTAAGTSFTDTGASVPSGLPPSNGPTGFATNAPNAAPAFGVALNAGTGACGAAASNGSYTCTFYIPGVPVGYQNFKVSQWNAAPTGCGANGNGCTFPGSAKALATNIIANQVVLQNQNNVFAFTLLPVVDSIAIDVAPKTLVDGAVSSGTAYLTVKDAAGNVIIGSDQFVDQNGNNITIRIASANTHVALATTAFDNAGASYLSSGLTYDGADMTTAGLQDLISVVTPSAASITGSLTNYTILFTKTTNGFGVPGVPQAGSQVVTAGAPTSIVHGPPGDAHVYAVENGKIAQIDIVAGTVSKEFAVTGTPTVVALGADNDIWYVDHTGGANKIGKFNPLTANALTGPFTQTAAVVDGATNVNIVALSASPNGNMYFVGDNDTNFFSVAPQTMAVTPQAANSGMTAITSANISNGDNVVCWAAGVKTEADCVDLTASTAGGTGPQPNVESLLFGLDGLLYIGEHGQIVVFRYNPAGSTTNMYTYTLANAGAVVNSMTVGHDGAVWFTETGSTNFVGRIQPGSGAKGVVTEFGPNMGMPAAATPNSITLGSDNYLWLTDNSTDKEVIQVKP